MVAKKKGHKRRLVLLDVHAILHRAFHGMPDFRSTKGEPTGALYGLALMLFSVVKDFEPDAVAACYDLPEPTFRDEIYDDYKAGRDKPDDTLIAQIERSRDMFTAFGIPIYEHAGFEADDMLGTIVEQTKGEKDLEIIVASGDHDTLSLADDSRVRVYTLRKGFNDTVLYDKKAVKEKFGFGPERLPDYKALRGDPSDNIPGVKGIGEKSATELLTTFGSLDKIYSAIKKPEKFEGKGFKPRILKLLQEGKEDAEFSLILATIRRDAPIKYELPKENWSASLPLAQIRGIFEELEFRSLVARLVELGATAPDSSEEASPEKGDVADEELLSVGIGLWVLNSDFNRPDLEDILKYTKKETFAEAREAIMHELKEKGLLEIYEEIELPLMPILRRAESRGIIVDRAYLKNLSKEYTKELKKIEKRIYKHAGSEFNINSPKQLGVVLFEDLGLKPPKKTSTGQASTNAAVLEKLKDEHEIVADILAYRELAKLLSTYIDSIPELLDDDSSLHTTFVQTGSATGRFASRDPNLQNIPIRSEHGRAIREAFKARPGYELVAFDYSQIDLRALAILSGDKLIEKIFSEGRDIHDEVAKYLFASGQDELDDRERRRRAKVINFGIVYGMGVNALRAQLGTTRKEAEEFHQAYFDQFPGVLDYLEETKKIARKQGYTETYFGHRRYYPGLKSPIEYVQKAAERQAANAPIQGTSADIIKIAMIEIDQMLESKGLRGEVELLLQIHDELIYEIKTDQIEAMSEGIPEIMSGVIKDSPIPLPVKVAHGKHWGQI